MPRAQAFFEDGIHLAHAFTHKASVAATAEAVRADPSCAMCLRGQALESGPTISYGESSEELKALAEMADKAAKLAETRGTPREREMIHALQLRYRDGGGGRGLDDRSCLPLTIQLGVPAVTADHEWKKVRARNVKVGHIR